MMWCSPIAIGITEMRGSFDIASISSPLTQSGTLVCLEPSPLHRTNCTPPDKERTRCALARHYGLSQAQVNDIILLKSWAHIA